MRRFLFLFVVLATLLVGNVAPPAMAQDYKKAPPAEELDRRADEYITGRRIVVILLVAGTLIGGMMGSVSRRRERRAARKAAAETEREEGHEEHRP